MRIFSARFRNFAGRKPIYSTVMLRFSSGWNQLPPVTKNIIIICALVYLMEVVGGVRVSSFFEHYGALHYLGATDFNVAQLITYMFLHGGFVHVLFNMFTLYMFGRILEQALGSKRFLFFYVSCGIGAALIQELVWGLTWRSTFIPMLANLNGLDFATMSQVIDNAEMSGEALPFLNNMLTIGASGAVFGLLLAFAMLFPNLPTYIFFIPVPVKAKWMVIGYGAIELLLAFSAPGSTIAHFAHLGGMIFGFILIYYWKRKGVIRTFY